MNLRTGKVRPLDGENLGNTVSALCDQFALLIDEAGYKLSLLSKDNQVLREELAAVKERLDALEQGDSA